MFWNLVNAMQAALKPRERIPSYAIEFDITGRNRRFELLLRSCYKIWNGIRFRRHCCRVSCQSNIAQFVLAVCNHIRMNWLWIRFARL